MVKKFRNKLSVYISTIFACTYILALNVIFFIYATR
jgi:hypothetical protein